MSSLKDNARKKPFENNLSLDWVNQAESPPAFVRLSGIEQQVASRGSSGGKGRFVLSLALFAGVFALFFTQLNSSNWSWFNSKKDGPQTAESLGAENLTKLDSSELEKLEALSNELQPSVVEEKNEVLEQTPAEGVSPLVEGEVEHVISTGETLSSIFATHGFSPQMAREVDSSLRKNKEVDHRIRPGQKFLFKRAIATGELESLTISLNPLETLKLERDEKSWSTSIDRVPTSTKRLEATGKIDNNFAEAAIEVGLNYEVVDEFVDLFSDKVRFHRDIQPGDEFAVIVDQEVLEDGTVVGNGPIIGASIKSGGSDFKAIKVKDKKGQERYVTEKGEPLGNTFLRYPLKFSRISSTFSHSRLHPVLKRRMPHLGVDFAAPRGTTVRSVADGKVTFAGRKGPNGIMVKITHNNRYRTAYLHLSKIASGIRSGSWVKRGQRIGAVGSTGRSTGPHLDFRLYDNGRSVDPLKAKLPKMSLGQKLVADKSMLKKIVNSLNSLMASSSVTPTVSNRT